MAKAHSDLLAKLKAFEAAHPKINGPRCAVCLLPDSFRRFVSEAKAKKSTSYGTIGTAVLSSEGEPVTHKSVANHVREHGESK